MLQLSAYNIRAPNKCNWVAIRARAVFQALISFKLTAGTPLILRDRKLYSIDDLTW